MSPLEAFLRHKRVWTKFKNNVKKQIPNSKIALQQLLDKDSIYQAIDSAFIWVYTSEGFRFWADLYEEAGGEHREGDYDDEEYEDDNPYF